MKIFNNQQLKQIDSHTLREDGIGELELIHRAGCELAREFMDSYAPSVRIVSIAGKGNNGADTIVMTKKLIEAGYCARIFVLRSSRNAHQKAILKELERAGYEKNIVYVDEDTAFGINKKDYDIILDGLFGTGLNKKVEGKELEIIRAINGSGVSVLSIDIPSGMYCEDNWTNNSTDYIHADRTFAIQYAKLCYVLDPTCEWVGDITFVDIGLKEPEIFQKEWVRMIDGNTINLLRRRRTAYKYHYGHALIAGGSKGMAGAPVLATQAVLRAGAGLVTSCVPSCVTTILHTSMPEAMVEEKGVEFLCGESNTGGKYSAIGIGPGMGTREETRRFLEALLTNAKVPVVLDADALNIISQNREMLGKIPAQSILTPHVAEFDRLFGKHESGYARFCNQLEWSKKLGVIIVLKGYRTCVTTPCGDVIFNTTGNPGMATAGSGDVLTGIITGLLARSYSPKEAAVYGAYLHGLAGDLAAAELTEECLIASDIVLFLPKAIQMISNPRYRHL